MTISLSILIFSLSVWLGLYLIARDPRKPRLRYTGLGLVCYAALIALVMLSRTSDFIVEALALRFMTPLLFLPGLCWFAATVELLPDDSPLRIKFGRRVGWLLALAGIILYVLNFISPKPIQHGDLLFFVLALVNVWLLLVAIYFVWGIYRAERSRRTLMLLLVVTVFFGLSNGLLLLPANVIPTDVMLLAIGLDMVLLAALIALLDAFDEGEALLPDAARSFAGALVYVTVFGGLVGLAVAPHVTPPLLGLLYSSIFFSTLLAVFADPIQGVIDRLIFARSPELLQERAELRTAAESLARQDADVDVLAMADAEFARLTRRALSNMNDLGKLAASPLMHLPLLDERLAGQNTLERAAELKAALTESIARLKPREDGASGTSDAWRYYNALYYPYVLGVKPYSVNNQVDGLDDEARAVLAWFQAQVPERTLHNWQNAAARLVAQDLREQVGVKS